MNALAALVIAASATTAASPNTPWIHLDVGLGVPFNVLMAIAFGAFVGVWNKRVEHKGNLLGAFAVSFIMTLVAVNHGADEAHLKTTGTDLLTQAEIRDMLVLAGGDVAVVRLPHTADTERSMADRSSTGDRRTH